MTVQGLIDQLEDLPRDEEVFVACFGFDAEHSVYPIRWVGFTNTIVKDDQRYLVRGMSEEEIINQGEPLVMIRPEDGI